MISKNILIVGKQPKTTQKLDIVNQNGDKKLIYLVQETPLTIYLNQKEIVTLMTMGKDPDLLVAGFLLNQQLIKEKEDLISIHIDWDVKSASVYTKNKNNNINLDKKTRTSGCGQGTMFSEVINNIKPLTPTNIKINSNTINHLLKQLSQVNSVYKEAGGVHSCALCTNNNIIQAIEDVGRHNALDALTGFLTLNHIEDKPTIIYTTGRLTSEMVIKAAQMDIPIIISRSSATSMGVDIAKKLNITLIARAKGNQFLILSHPNRLDISTIKAIK